jgi:putative tricarboxylic transport membrane protein
VALLLPLTFSGSAGAIILLCGIYYGSMYGGTITSVLINTRGISNRRDGPTAISSRARSRRRRLGIATIASFVAGTLGTVALMLTVPARGFALTFGPPGISR